MLRDGKQPVGLDMDEYIQSQTRFRILRSKLPEDSAKSLAREVLRRLAERDNDELIHISLDEKIERLCHALLSPDDHAGARFVEDLRVDGVSVEDVYLKYLAAAANMLGDWWVEDKVSFIEVTIGTSRMYGIMRALRPQLFVKSVQPTRSAVFVAVPGETHNLGVHMATDLFRKDGWDIELKIGKTHDELIDEISQMEAIIIGVSASGNHSIEALSRLVIALRFSNPTASILVSGNIVQEAGETVALMGVDGMAKNMEEARALVSRLWEAARER